MYLAALLVVIEQALILGRLDLWLYAGGIWVITIGFVRWIEEPSLPTQFGVDYETYRARCLRGCHDGGHGTLRRRLPRSGDGRSALAVGCEEDADGLVRVAV